MDHSPVSASSLDAGYHHKHSWVFLCQVGMKEKKLEFHPPLLHELFRHDIVYQAVLKAKCTQHYKSSFNFQCMDHNSDAAISMSYKVCTYYLQQSCM